MTSSASARAAKGPFVEVANAIFNTAVPTPVLFADLRQVKTNIAAMVKRTTSYGVALRPHFKTSKCLEIAALQAEGGATGFTCATPAEIRALLAAGQADLLWAYQPVGRDRVQLAVSSNRAARVAVAVDSGEVAGALEAVADQLDVVVPVYIEVDTGLSRAGLRPSQVADFAAYLAASYPHLAVTGIMTHEGHLGKYVGQREALRQEGLRVGKELVQVAEWVRARHVACPTVSVGSTPGADSTPTISGITEARPGTYVFNDCNQVALGSASWSDCALGVAARVISRPKPEVAIIDAGSKALSSDRPASGGSSFGVVVADGDVEFNTANEEHGRLTGPGAAKLLVGDVVAVVPNHACGTVNMWSSVLVADGGAIVDEWKIVARHGGAS